MNLCCCCCCVCVVGFQKEKAVLDATNVVVCGVGFQKEKAALDATIHAAHYPKYNACMDT